METSIRRRVQSGCACPQRTERRKAMETSKRAKLIARDPSPQRTERRKAMETFSAFQLLDSWFRPQRTERRKAMETRTNRFYPRRFQRSPADRTPKGNGDRRPWTSNRARYSSPQRTERRKAIETQPCRPRLKAFLGPQRTERRKAMETGILERRKAFVTVVPSGQNAERQWRLDRGWWIVDGGSVCPQRTERRKAMETEHSQANQGWQSGVPSGQNAERQWRLHSFNTTRILVVPSPADRTPKGNGDKIGYTANVTSFACPQRTERRKAMETKRWRRLCRR